MSWPKPQPDFINQGRKRVQPLMPGLKTLLAVFLRPSVSQSQCSFSACVVGLIFLTSLSSCRQCLYCLSASLSHALLINSVSEISKQYLLEQDVRKVIMVYGIIPVETRELPYLHEFICFILHVARDGWVAGDVSLKTWLSYVVVGCKCLWLPSVSLFGAFFVVFYNWLWLFVWCWLSVVKAMFPINP